MLGHLDTSGDVVVVVSGTVVVVVVDVVVVVVDVVVVVELVVVELVVDGVVSGGRVVASAAVVGVGSVVAPLVSPDAQDVRARARAATRAKWVFIGVMASGRGQRDSRPRRCGSLAEGLARRRCDCRGRR